MLEDFQAGPKRKRVKFVPAEEASIHAPTAAPCLSLGERYLSIALKDKESSTSLPKAASVAATVSSRGHDGENMPAEGTTCGICKGLIESGSIGAEATCSRHEASLAHQVCLEHSHPPSHLDRNRHGLRYLSSYGWDPDSQDGLGPSGAGIRVPVKAKAKHDTVGLGATIPEIRKTARSEAKLNAKDLRKKELKEKAGRRRLHQVFYVDDEVNKYLGVG